MLNLKGDSKYILTKIKKLTLHPPDNWERYDCKDENFIGKHYWFKYIGNKYPTCFLYIPINTFDGGKVNFMILPNNNEECDIILNDFDGIVHSFFDEILDEKITLEDK